MQEDRKMEIYGYLYLFHTTQWIFARKKPSRSSRTMKTVRICLQSISCTKPGIWIVASLNQNKLSLITKYHGNSRNYLHLP